MPLNKYILFDRFFFYRVGAFVGGALIAKFAILRDFRFLSSTIFVITIIVLNIIFDSSFRRNKGSLKSPRR